MSRNLRLNVGMTVLICCWLMSGVAQTIQTNFWVPNGQVNSLVQKNNILYLGGNFDQVGKPLPWGLSFDRLSANANSSVGLPDHPVRAVISDGASGWYLGGDFSQIGTVSRSGFAHMSASGVLDSWAPVFSGGGIGGFILSGNTLFVYGSFTSIDGVTRNRVASFDLTTHTLNAFNPNVNGGVNGAALSGTTLYIVGGFGSVGGTGRSQAAAVNSTTGAVTSFNPNVFGNSTKTVATNGTTVYIAGDFQRIGGSSGTLRLYIAALNPTTGAPTVWNPQCDNTISSLMISGSTLYVSGYFSSMAGQGRRSLAAFNTTSGAITPLTLGSVNAINLAVFSMSLYNDTLYMGGLKVTQAFGYPVPYTNSINVVTNQLTTWDPALAYYPWAYGSVFGLAANANEVYIGGQFHSVNNVGRKGLAALSAATGQPVAWNPSTDGVVSALALSGNTLYAGGRFTTVGGQARHGLAAIDIPSALPGNFDPGGVNSNGSNDPVGDIYAIAVKNGSVYVGGNFQSLGDPLNSPVSRSNFAELDSATGAVNATDLPTDNVVRSLTTDGNYLYMGGDFGQIGQDFHTYIAQVDLASKTTTTWEPYIQPGFQGIGVTSMAASNGSLFVGGGFQGAAGMNRAGLVKLDLGTAQVSAWDPHLLGIVTTLALDSNFLYIGGSQFMIQDTVYRNAAASYDLATAEVTSWNPAVYNFSNADNPSPDYLVSSISAGSAGVILGGSFTGFDTQIYHGMLSGGYTSNATLPLTLGAFQATPVQQNDRWEVRCRWSTYSEANTSRFIIQRSVDGKIFVPIGQTFAAGNSNNLRSYAFTDSAAVEGISYYRLQSVDIDERLSYSPIVKVIIAPGNLMRVTLFPKPAQDTGYFTG